MEGVKSAPRRRRPPPQGLDERTSPAGLRAVATFEAVKGTIVLLLGLGLLALLHKDVEEAAEGLLVHLHVNPDRRLAHAFLEAASRLTDARLWGVRSSRGVCGRPVYGGVGIVEPAGMGRMVRSAVRRVVSPVGNCEAGGADESVARGGLSGQRGNLLYMAYIRVNACRYGPCEEEAQT